MPAVTYLSDHEVREWSIVKDDKDCNELLQELRSLTGENWIIGTQERWPRKRWFRKQAAPVRFYTLYADCHGEWQVINLVTPNGGSIFHGSSQSREDVMNFMLGIVCGWHDARKTSAFDAEARS